MGQLNWKLSNTSPTITQRCLFRKKQGPSGWSLSWCDQVSISKGNKHGQFNPWQDVPMLSIYKGNKQSVESLIRRSHVINSVRKQEQSGRWRSSNFRCLAMERSTIGLTHICINASLNQPSLGQIMACCLTGTSHYLNQCWDIVNWTLRDKLKWNLNRNSHIFIQENAFENVVWKMAAILSRPQCVNLWAADTIPSIYQWKKPWHCDPWVDVAMLSIEKKQAQSGWPFGLMLPAKYS